MKTGIHWQDPKYAVGQDFTPDPSLVLYLPLNSLDGAGVNSEDVHGHSCTVTGALWRPHGRYFDGSDDYISCGSAPPCLFASKSFTLEAWVRSSITGQSAYLIHKGQAIGTNNRYYFIMAYTVPSNLIRFYVNDGAHAWDYYQASFGTQSSIFDGNWQHLVGTVDLGAELLQVFLNGEYVAQDSLSGLGDISHSNNLIIGANSGNPSSNNFAGDIGKVRIYNRALTPSEIQQNYLVTRWRYQ